MPKSAITITLEAATNVAKIGGAVAPIKIVPIKIIVGKRPLQIEKLFVIMAIRRSRGLSIIRVETTPAALQPNPIIIESDCFPCAPARLKSLSKLNATRGKYPKSSKIVKSGKKIAIGGSITLITQAVPR